MRRVGSGWRRGVLGSAPGVSGRIQGNKPAERPSYFGNNLCQGAARLWEVAPVGVRHAGPDEGPKTSMHYRILPSALLALTPILASAAVDVRVTIENLSPANGTYLTPLWVGFHDGTFDLYDMGAPVSPNLERLAEDGNTAPISTAFGASGVGAMDGTIMSASGPFAPGASASMDFTLDASSPNTRYFSYAAMVIPSNDAFIANGDPMAISLFDSADHFVGADFLVLGDRVLDAGTEVNDELPANTAFFGQATPNTGTDENGVVHLHTGFMPAGSGGILDDPMFANADFTAVDYRVARITVTAVPEGTTVLSVAGLAALLGAAGWRRFGCRG